MKEKLPMAKATLDSSRAPQTLQGKDVAYAAARLGCSESNIYRLVEAGALQAVNVGAPGRRRPTLRFEDDALDAFIASRRSPAPVSAPRDDERFETVAPAPHLTLVGQERYR